MKTRITIGFCALLLLLVSCTATDQQGSVGENALNSSAASAAELFPLAAECVECHDSIAATDGISYSFVNDWRNSTHAQSALDPYFMAVVRSETMMLPEASDLIQETCAGCHLPMADLSAQAVGSSRNFLDNAAVPGHQLYNLYAEGTSCMICHQLNEVDTTGSLAFLDSRLFIDLSTRGTDGGSSVRQLYGYHEIGEAGQQPMLEAFGYRSAQSDAERKSSICKVCHTLYTDSFTVDGVPTGTKLPEQVPALEWLHSSLADQSCQSCHMPVVTDAGPLSNNGINGEVQGRIGAHSFVGANSYLMELNNHAFGPFESGIQDINGFLQTKTATLSLSGRRGPTVAGSSDPPDYSVSSASSAAAASDANRLLLDVRIDSLTGHKFPTGFPSRRAWLHVVVFNETGAVIFESGAWNDTGMILDNDADLVVGSFEPHYQVIDAPGQVQIYESIMLDSEGMATTNLLQGLRFGKDNRLLPPGFDKQVVAADIAVIGEAFGDEDFVGGSDSVQYRIAVPTDSGKLTLEVELVYQAIGYRFLKNLEEHPSAEQGIMAERVKQTPNTPVVVVRRSLIISN
jgi:hypothetical protein